jgi:hypothetical protein
MTQENTDGKSYLIEKTKAFISDALNELSVVVERINWRDIRYYQQGTDIVQQISTRPDFHNIIPNAEFNGRLPSTKAFSQFLSSNDAFLSMKKRIIDATQIEWNWLYPHFVTEDVLTEYLWLVNSLRFNDDVATTVATNFVNFIYNPVSEITFYSVLRGVNSSFERIEFCDNVKIRKLSLDEVSSLVIRNDSLRLKDRIPENCVVLEEAFTFNYGRLPGDVFGKLSNKFDLIVEVLRIIKRGRVDRENLYWRWDKLGQLGNREIGSSGRARPIPPIAKSYSLESDDILPLERIYECLKNRPTAHRIARQRFNEASQRAKSEDVVIDLCIALEALLNDDPGSLSYKLGMRAAILVGNTPNEKRHILDLVSDAYSFRSAFVHGGSSQKNSKKLELSLDELSQELLETFRRILRAAMEYQITNQKAISPIDLDNMLLK